MSVPAEAMDQGGLEWAASRVGKITASRMCDVLAFSKRDGKPLQARENYLCELVTEILTGEALSIGTSAPLQWGRDCEPAARAAYEARHGCIVDECGFLLHGALAYVGASPDGLCGADGGIEIKCPYNSMIHLRTVMHGMPEDHRPQVQAAMWVTERAYWDFVSYDPRMPPHLRLYVQRVPRDDAYLQVMHTQCLSLWDAVQAMLVALLTRGQPA